MSYKSPLEELIDIKKKFNLDKNSDKAFRSIFILLLTSKRKSNSLKKKIDILEEEISNLKNIINDKEHSK